MPSYEDLKRINKANSIINRSNLSIGLRPMHLEGDDGYEESSQRINRLESGRLKSEVDRLLQDAKENDIITAEEYYASKNYPSQARYEREYSEEQEFEPEYYEAEYFEEEVQETKKQEVNFQQNQYFDAETLNSRPLFETYPQQNQSSNVSFSKTLLYTSCAVIASIYLIFTFKPVSTASDTNKSVEQTKLQKLTKTVSSTEARSLIITSGNFLTKANAESYLSALKAKLGVPLELVKNDKTYSIQIGPAYANHDDALLVFDELSRYSVEELSIKIAS